MATLLGQLCYSRYVVLMSLNPIVLLDCFSVSLTFRLYCRSNSIGFHYIYYGLLRKFVTNLDQNFCMHCHSRTVSIFYGTEIETWPSFGPVSISEK